MLHVGRFTVSPVVDIPVLPMPNAAIFPHVSQAEMHVAQDRLGPSLVDAEAMTWLLVVQGFVIRTPGTTVLVEACVGNEKSRPNRPWLDGRKGRFLEELAALGIAPEAIDIVCCTHMHVDHVGWNTRLVDGTWVPTFPNARYLFGRTEFSYWEAENAIDPMRAGYGAFDDSVLPVVRSGQAELVAENHEIAAGLQFEHFPGHTPGNAILHVRDADDHAVCTGDVIHHPVQLAHPDWPTALCSDPAAAAAARVRLLERYADTATVFVPTHFRTPTFGRIVRSGDAFAIVAVDAAGTTAAGRMEGG